MHLALYRSERPENFNEIIGQRHIVKILNNQLKKGSISQSYLFTGTRGTGKTTTARIIAKAVNCIGDVPDDQKPCCQCENCRAIKDGSFLDVVELDAASNNGVDDLRAIIDSVQYPPAYGKYKVYIIDEVHMLSQSAENAFLKTLEEPPSYAIFILATTNPEKVRQTIRSRCMMLNFKRVSENDLKAGMRAICDRRGINITDEALGAVATRADGSVRDALSILEQCVSGGDELVTYDLVLEYMGSAGLDFYISLTDAVIRGNAAQALVYVDSIIKEGKDSKQVISDWLQHFRDLMISKYITDPTGIVNASAENVAKLKTQASQLTAKRLENIITLLAEYVNQTKYSAQPRILLETAVIQILSRQAAGKKLAISEEIDASFNLGNVQQAAQNMPQAQPVTQPKAQAPARTSPAPAARPVNQAQAHNTSTQKAQPKVIEPEPIVPADIPQYSEGNTNIDAMWKRVVEEVSKIEGSFGIMVGNYSKPLSFKNDELIVIVKKNKVGIAELSKDNVERVVKMIFGSTAFVTFRAGDINSVRPASSSPAARSQAATPAARPQASSVPQQAPVQEPEVQAEPDMIFGSPAEVDIDMDAFGMVEEDVALDMLFEQDSNEGSLADDIAGDASALLGLQVDVVDL